MDEELAETLTKAALFSVENGRSLKIEVYPRSDGKRYDLFIHSNRMVNSVLEEIKEAEYAYITWEEIE